MKRNEDSIRSGFITVLPYYLQKKVQVVAFYLKQCHEIFKVRVGNKL